MQVVQVLIIALDHEGGGRTALQVPGGTAPTTSVGQQEVRTADQCFSLSHHGDRDNMYRVSLQSAEPENLFVNYLSRIHRDEVQRAPIFVCLKNEPDFSALRVFYFSGIRT